MAAAATAAAEAAKSDGGSAAAESFIGSFISVISKSDIRYEGVLFHIDPQESIIGLRNVKSFGTEGRKKDGPQILLSDKVYEYIFFRGSDIKDLQVLSTVQSTPTVLNDPAIIQSHYPHSTSASSSLTTSGAAQLGDYNSSAELGLPTPALQGNLPVYQSVGNSGSWDLSFSSSIANNSVLSLPKYQPGFTGSTVDIPHLHHQSLPPLPRSLVVSPPVQKQMLHYGMNASLKGVGLNLAEHPHSLQQPVSTGFSNSASTSHPSSALPCDLPNASSATVAYNSSPSVIPSDAPNALSNVALDSSSSSVSYLFTNPSVNAVVSPVDDKPKSVIGPPLPYQTMPQSIPSIVGTNRTSLSEASVSSSLPTGQLLWPGLKTPHSVQTAQKDKEIVRASVSKPESSNSKNYLESVEQLPSQLAEELNGAVSLNTHHSNRGHGWGRGNGVSSTVTKFTEDFDFEAMNEKFNKEEVWGLLGKSKKAGLKDKIGDKNESEGQGEAEDELPNFDTKPVYVKDDFFDSISSSVLDHEYRRGRMKFSEQRRMDTETFGEFRRPRRTRRGHGGQRLYFAGIPRGSYTGRGRGRTDWCRVT